MAGPFTLGPPVCNMRFPAFVVSSVTCFGQQHGCCRSEGRCRTTLAATGQRAPSAPGIPPKARRTGTRRSRRTPASEEPARQSSKATVQGVVATASVIATSTKNTGSGRGRKGRKPHHGNAATASAPAAVPSPCPLTATSSIAAPEPQGLSPLVLCAFEDAVRDAASTGNLLEAEKWLDRAADAGAVISAEVFGELIQTAVLIEEDGDAVEGRGASQQHRERPYLQRMDKLGLELDARTLETLVHASSERGEVDEALGWLGKLQALGTKTTVAHLNHIVKACVKERPANASRAEELFVSMARKHSISPNGATLSILNKVVDSRRVRKLCQDIHLDADSAARDASFVGEPKWVQSSELFGDLNKLASEGKVYEAEEVFHNLEGTTGPDKKRMLINTVIKACAKAGDYQRAEKWFHYMLEMRIKPNRKTFGKLMDAAMKGGNPGVTKRWFEAMEDFGFAADAVNFNMLLLSVGMPRDDPED